MAPKIWRFLDSGKESAFFHMALDEVLLNAVRDSTSSPVFRLYEWEPTAVTLGYSQKIYDIVDAGRCRRDGIDITRRLTGGRAVLHENEIAYTVIAPIDDPVFGGPIMGTYQAVSELFVAAFRGLDIPAEMSKGALNAAPGTAPRRELPCFLSTARHEITLHGRKLVGSAQRRIGGVFIQQGSIIFGPGHERLAEYLVDTDMADTCRREFERGHIDLLAETDGILTRDTLKKALFKAFQDAVGGSINRDLPDENEYRKTETLQHVKYSAKGWIEDHG